VRIRFFIYQEFSERAAAVLDAIQHVAGLLGNRVQILHQVGAALDHGLEGPLFAPGEFFLVL